MLPCTSYLVCQDFPTRDSCDYVKIIACGVGDSWGQLPVIVMVVLIFVNPGSATVTGGLARAVDG